MDSDLIKQLPDAPRWALVTGEAGRYFVLGGIGLFVLAVVLWLLQAKQPKLTRLATFAFFGGSLCVLGTMASLLALFIKDQFEFQYVMAHADSQTTLNYKIAGVWTAQQGSFLLWACTSALFGMLAFRAAKQYRRWYAISFSIFLAAICGILAYDTPFKLLDGLSLNGVIKMPHNGSGMTPALQNYWVVIHPPTIFMGFGSLTVMFALSVAAMVTGNITDWVKIVRPWALLSASILGLGLCMGGMWAYETQGWGGFWAWDPVENVSFVPWLFTIALIHGIIVQVTKKRWIRSNLLFGGLPFLTFVYGTFLTRSGLLDKVSVHSFAEMNHSALVILEGFILAVAAAFFLLFFVRGLPLGKTDHADSDTPGIDREDTYRTGILLLSLMATGIAIGMSWPWWSAFFQGGVGSAVEEKQYHLVVVWFFLPILILMGIAPFVSWKKMGAKEIFNKLVSVLSITAGLTGFGLVAIQNQKFGVHMLPDSTVTMPFHYRMALLPWMAVLLFVCVFTAVANTWRAAELFKRSKLGIGGFVAHIGLAILMTGLIISRGFEQKDGGIVDQVDGPKKILGYTIAFKKLDQKSPEDRDGKVVFSVDGPDGQKFDATPGLYYYPGDDGAPTAMVWPYVQKYLSHDFYMAMNKPEIYAWQKPLEFTEGETKVIKGPGDEDSPDAGMSVTYKKFVMEGDPGAVGTSFGAQLHIVDQGQSYDVVPKMKITGDGPPDHDLPLIGRDYRMAMLGMDPASKSVTLQLLFSRPLYPIILFYKPMTILVWIGTGVMTLGGLLAAFSRRYKKPVSTEETLG